MDHEVWNYKRATWCYLMLLALEWFLLVLNHAEPLNHWRSSSWMERTIRHIRRPKLFQLTTGSRGDLAVVHDLPCIISTAFSASSNVLSKYPRVIKTGMYKPPICGLFFMGDHVCFHIDASFLEVAQPKFRLAGDNLLGPCHQPGHHWDERLHTRHCFPSFMERSSKQLAKGRNSRPCDMEVSTNGDTTKFLVHIGKAN